MLRTTALITNLKKINSLVVFLILFGGAGCTSTANKPDTNSPMKRVYFYPFDNVWRAAQMAVARYPILINNADTGVLETEPIKGDLAWIAPHQTKANTLGRKYKVTLLVFRGKAEGKEGVMVTVKKKVELQRDFLTSETLASDGLEESSILYRIERELAIEKAIKKSIEKKNEDLDLLD